MPRSDHENLHYCEHCRVYLQDIICPRCSQLMVKARKPPLPAKEYPSKWTQERRDAYHSPTERFAMTSFLLRRLHQSGIRD